jgi:hypothetical protein
MLSMIRECNRESAPLGGKLVPRLLLDGVHTVPKLQQRASGLPGPGARSGRKALRLGCRECRQAGELSSSWLVGTQSVGL